MNDEFIKNAKSRGKEGERWLNDLLSLVKLYEEKWQLECFDPFQLSYNYVLPAKTKSGEQVVLKIGFPSNQEFEVGTYLRNPLADLPKNSNFKLIETNRILQFSEELNLDKRNLQKWTFANAIISLLWFLEDKRELKEIYLRNAELISGITF